MKLDLRLVSFSYKGSYMAISDISEGHHGYDIKSGIYLRTIHGSARTQFVARIIPVKNGKPVDFTYEETPSELNFIMDGGKISICFENDRLFLIQAEGSQIGIKFDFLSENGRYDYIYSITGVNHTYYMANCYKNNCRYLMWGQSGNVSIEQEWEESSAKYSRILFETIDGYLLAGFQEIATEWNKDEFNFDYKKTKAKSVAAFQAFCKSMPSIPDEYQDAHALASYVNYASIVHKEGFLTRDAMLMSKNGMCNVWSWDHCFNAIALSYHNPQAAWDQFMIMFDVQDETGLIPDSVNDVHVVWNYCKPPIHGWALSKMMEHMELTLEQVAEAYHRLSKWTNWWLTNRDYDGDGICEYNHGNDSGWDNSTAFRVLPPVETPELQAYLILQMEMLSRLAVRSGKFDEEHSWTKKADEMLKLLVTHNFRENKPVVVKSGSHEIIENDSLLSYETLVLGNRLPKEARDNMVEVLKSDKFYTEHGFATESPSSAYYKSNGYWRGPIWAPSTMILLDGLAQCDEMLIVRDVAKKFVDMVQTSGCAENFDALSGEGLCDRAYTWTSSAMLVMAHEYLMEKGE